MTIKTLTLLWCACSLSFAGTSQPARAAGEIEGYQYAIRLEVPPGQRKLLEEHLDVYRWRGNPRLDESQLKRLVRLAPRQISEFLASEGFYSPRIEAELRQQEAGREVRLLVIPGEPARVADIDIRLTGPINDAPPASLSRLGKLKSDWSLQPGAVFRQQDWESAKRNVLKDLLLEGYPAAAITHSRAVVNPETRRVELQLTVGSGAAFAFGPLLIEGLNRYPASLVERINPITPGEPYSQAKLLELQSRLQDSPYFSQADISVDLDSNQPTGLPIRVAVSENPSRKLGFGIGMSTDTGARTQMDYRDINLFDRALRLGGALKLDQKRQSLGGDLQFPLTQGGHRDSIDTLLEHTDIEAQTTRKLGIGARRSFIRDGAEISVGLRYLTERQDLPGAPGQRRTTLSPFYSWTSRNVDHLLDPTRGYLVNLQVAAASRKLLSDQDFLRGLARADYFHPFGNGDQLLLRGEVGAVAARSRDGIPSDYLFRTGGDQTIRGYAYQSLGVREGGAVVGGRYLVVASAEYVHWITGRWGAAVFADAGNAADSLHELTPVYGYGLGGRWKSPVGPLKLDLGYGQSTGALHLHFSVGFAF